MANQMPRFRFNKTSDTNNSFQAKRKQFLKKVEKDRKNKTHYVDRELEALRKRLWPDFGEKKEDLQPSDIKLFRDLPISKKTLAGLDTLEYTKPTDIQRESLLFSLRGNDILGAAKTGSGKTLAFLIPILETLFRQNYTPGFGMAALIISPTRELAYQSYDVLRKLGKKHHMAFGLAIGGMFLQEEAEKIQSANVLICTPGRLLQHFEQTPNFSADDLKVLVLDEADKILDMGFKETLDNIIESLPRQRQTLLFSATQTKSVKSLARLSLKKPIYISAHEKAKEVTPQRLNQRYIVCDMQDKVDMLWSFLKSHHRHKLLVFLSSCKQVRYLTQAFKKLNLGMSVLSIHGHMKQLQRVEAYEVFSRKRRVIMLATDVAARGLDFPTVDWIVQMDKPENVDTYIHRVGRTARYDKVGEALLMLLPSEEEQMVQSLKKRKIPIVKMHVAKKKLLSVGRTLASHCASDRDLKSNAGKAYISAMKTLYVLDKPSFNEIEREAYAASLGLVQTPKLPFLSESKSKTEDIDDDGDEGTSKKNHFQNYKVGKKTLDFNIGDDDDDKDDDIYKIVKSSTSHDSKDGNEETLWIEEGKKAIRKKGSYKEKIKLLEQSKLLTFDDEGNPEEDEYDEDGLDVNTAIERLREEDKHDKAAHRMRIKQEHREKRLLEKQEKEEQMMEKIGVKPEAVAVLGNPNESDEEDDADDDADIDDDGPPVKRQKMDKNMESDDHDDDDDDDDADEEKDGNEDSEEEEMDDDDEGESESDDDESDSEGNPDDLEQDEAAVLALLKGKR